MSTSMDRLNKMQKNEKRICLHLSMFGSLFKQTGIGGGGGASQGLSLQKIDETIDLLTCRGKTMVEHWTTGYVFTTLSFLLNLGTSPIS